ncbi:TPA: conjugative transfer signal peptidase TraF [Legionella pneumophila]|nr:conjugative transfer signal peptidase TraF [Legionella pneumophila]HEM6992031.1 conjugative transfer signal peptidase TraF [Legionella pneumophila]HEM7051947.1 conjugative transfer signal peptidase TraF [Legionella pneumophila]HEM7061473.1 conjugative transfer signal peptidase TraF [Legionella pneumophila]HEM7077501.1 conjugative transfer signal peptidase TraF [Legionella pneumophila]
MKKLSIIIAIFLISTIAVGILFHSMGFRINLTESIPIGLYRIAGTEPLKNTYVIFCPDDRQIFRLAKNRGYIGQGLNCSGYGYLMKKVVAVSGDTLSVTPEGVFINQQLLPFSKPKLTDGMYRILPQWRKLDYPLKKNEVMTMTNQSEWSFDGRYYGLVHTRQIKGVITPIWVVNNAPNFT